MKSVTLKFGDKRYNEIKKYYTPYFKNKKGEYLDFYAVLKDVTVTGYITKKVGKSIVFAGKKAEEESSLWEKSAVKIKLSKNFVQEKLSEQKTLAKKTVNNIKEKVKKTTTSWVYSGTQIGSDEVGVGDFLGPMIVVACYVKKENVKAINALGVKDSKLLTDLKIREIAPELIKLVDYSKLTLSNTKYNAMIYQNENLNSLKAKMHNRALLNMVDKHTDAEKIFIDQFVAEDKYYSYLNDEEERQVKGITFQTKGETSYPSIAAASIIARYCFLIEMDELSEKYKMAFPFGAASKVDEFAKKFIEKYGISEFNQIAKMNFANYKKAIQG